MPRQIPTEDLIPVPDGTGEIDAVGPWRERWARGDRVTVIYFKDWIDGPHVQGIQGVDARAFDYVKAGPKLSLIGGRCWIFHTVWDVLHHLYGAPTVGHGDRFRQQPIFLV